MPNYETMIVDHLNGTPKEKYEYLLNLEKENAEMKGQLSHCFIVFDALLQTANEQEVLANFKSIFESKSEQLSKFKLL